MNTNMETEDDVFDIKNNPHGDVIPVEEFLESLKSTVIMCSDGCGNYVKNGRGYESPALSFTPYTFKHDVEEHGFTHVLWFNK